MELSFHQLHESINACSITNSSTVIILSAPARAAACDISVVVTKEGSRAPRLPAWHHSAAWNFPKLVNDKNVWLTTVLPFLPVKHCVIFFLSFVNCYQDYMEFSTIWEIRHLLQNVARKICHFLFRENIYENSFMSMSTKNYVIQRILQELKVKGSVANFSTTACRSNACNPYITAGQRRRDEGEHWHLLTSLQAGKNYICVCWFSLLPRLHVLLQVTPGGCCMDATSCITGPEPQAAV